MPTPVVTIVSSSNRQAVEALLSPSRARDAVTDRTVAQRWHGRYLVVPFEELPLPEEGAVYLHELAGMTVLDAEGRPAGTIRGYYQLPQGIVLEIDSPGGPRDVPFNEAFVRDIDRAARAMVVLIPDESQD